MILEYVTPDYEFEKTVVDFLIYIEKVTDISFNQSTLKGVTAMVTFDEEEPMDYNNKQPQNIYSISSTYYPVQFVVWYCPITWVEKITTIELIPTVSDCQDYLKVVVAYLEDITPEILIISYESTV
jgi:hypothetical protein